MISIYTSHNGTHDIEDKYWCSWSRVVNRWLPKSSGVICENGKSPDMVGEVWRRFDWKFASEIFVDIKIYKTPNVWL